MIEEYYACMIKKLNPSGMEKMLHIFEFNILCYKTTVTFSIVKKILFSTNENAEIISRKL